MQMKRPKSLCMCNKLKGEIQAGEIWVPAHFILYVCTYTIFIGWCWFNEQVMIRHISASGLYLIQVRPKFRVGGGALGTFRYRGETWWGSGSWHDPACRRNK